jgi:hypothetical protein
MVGEQARAVAERQDIQRRQLELEEAQLTERRARQHAMQVAYERVRVLEREGRVAEAAELHREFVRLAQEHERAQLANEEKRLALQREAMEIEYRAELAELEFAEQEARRGHENMEASLNRDRERREWTYALQTREVEAQAAAQALRAKELEAQALQTDGRHDEAQAARAEAERMRQKVESLHRDIQEEHLLRAASELELQIESQLEALRHIQGQGATDATEVQKGIARLEAALAALRDTEH